MYPMKCHNRSTLLMISYAKPLLYIAVYLSMLVNYTTSVSAQVSNVKSQKHISSQIATRQNRMKSNTKGHIKRSAFNEWIGSIIFAVIAATFVHNYFFQPYIIPTGSLEKSLLIGDFLFVSKFFILFYVILYCYGRCPEASHWRKKCSRARWMG